jgi:acyl-CoA synthetase (NDP forming)
MSCGVANVIKNNDVSSAIISAAKAEGRSSLLETEAKTICTGYGIPVPRFEIAETRTDAAKLAAAMGYPVVLKIISPEIVHKSDAGGVILNLQSATDVEKAYDQILVNVKKNAPNSKILGIEVTQMAPSGVEVIIGSIKDSQFGQTLMFGLGGIFVELFKDVAFRIAPITEDEATEMITEIKSYPLLKGYRNTPPSDLVAIKDILIKLSKMVMDHPEIKETDLNPTIIYKKGAITVDARIILE